MTRVSTPTLPASCSAPQEARASDTVLKIITEAVEIEKAFLTDALPVSLIA